MSTSQDQMNGDQKGKTTNGKIDDLQRNYEEGSGEHLTTNQGVRINDNQNTLKAGERGPSLLEDFIMREKITHFDHERIPERIVHARAAAAHGYFEPYESAAKLSRAAFLQNPSTKTPVFVRLSTVVGFRGSTDLARDVRGFAVKFYTEEGIFDLVGNNMPVFFIQDAMKFPDLVHSIKPEPHNEIPQASAAHDTFWDFVSTMPESLHTIMWVLSDRAIPRSLRMMEGFGVHTFRLIGADGTSNFVKFHWKPKLGVHGVVWDEAVKISGADPDFHRRDLWDAIERGDFPEWELGVQVIPEEDEHSFDFDLLDPTKLVPEELVPVTRIGRMVLNRNPENYFAETEQVAFHPGHIVPGIDFTNDPLLQGRLFSYTDTQLKRLGSPNFAEIPINRPTCPVHNNQRDGHMRQTINRGQVAYEPNTLAAGCPMQAPEKEGGFVSHPERIDAHKVRARSASFTDHYSQAALFYNSQSEPEKKHIINAQSFELGKVKSEVVRRRMLVHLSNINSDLAARVAENLGMEVPSADDLEQPLNLGYPADADPQAWQPTPFTGEPGDSPALSMIRRKDGGPDEWSIKTRMIAFLVADGVNGDDVEATMTKLTDGGAAVRLIAPHQGSVTTADGGSIPVHGSFSTDASVLYDAVYVPGGAKAVGTLKKVGKAIHFVNEAYMHCKAIGASGEGVDLLTAGWLANESSVAEFSGDESLSNEGVCLGATADDEFTEAFVEAIAAHRHWEREDRMMVPA